MLLLASNAHGQADAHFSKGDSAVTKERVRLKLKKDWSSGDPSEMLEQFEKVEVLGAGITSVKVRVDSETTGWVYYRKLMDMEEARSKMAAEKRRQEAVQKRREAGRRHVQELRRKGYSIELDNLTYSINSAGGVTPTVTFDNISDINNGKTIKYAAFTLTPYNSVGDPVHGTTDGESTVTVEGVGPIGPTERAVLEFDNVWYNETVDCIEVRKIKLEFLDGSSFTYVNDLKDIAERAPSVNLRGDCRL